MFIKYLVNHLFVSNGALTQRSSKAVLKISCTSRADF